jgi:signal transduction histidine kinase/ligand-binding sensor domain-containing protein
MLLQMRRICALCAAILVVTNASASPRPDITEYLRTALGPAQGAPAIPWRLAQTSDGFLWIGTPAGLYRFDGVRFERISSLGTARLLDQSITALMAPLSGGLWIGYEYGGASFLDGETLRNYPAASGGLPSGSVYSFVADFDGVLWAATTRGLSRFDGRRWTDVTKTLGLPSPATFEVVADKTGNLWIRSGGQVALLRRGSTKVHVYALSVAHPLLRGPGGRVWANGSHPDCLYLLDPTQDADPPCRPRGPEYEDFWFFDHSGNLWVADATEHVRILPVPAEGEPARPQDAVPPPSNQAFLAFGGQLISSLEDREGNVWFGTTAGLEQLRVSRLRSHGPFLGFVVLGAGNHNSLWIGTTNIRRPGADFFQLNQGLMVPYAGGPTSITASYRDSTGVLWAGGYGRLWSLEERTWEEIAAPPEISNAPGNPRRPTQAIVRDASGAVWLSMVQTGLFKLEDRRWSPVAVPGIPASEYPLVMCVDATGSVWLGYAHARMATLTHGAWRLYTERDGVSVGNVQVLTKVNDQIWSGGDQGVGRIRDGRFEALPALNALGGITGLLQARNGDLWLNTSNGAARISRQELPRLDMDPAPPSIAYETFDFQDGMPGVARAVRPLPSVLESDDGRIWFDVSDHYAWVDPTEHLRNTVTPAVIIRSVTDDGRRRDAQDSLALFPNTHNIVIDYTATSLSIPSRVRFKYRLEHFEAAWQDAGSRRAAYYNNLPPGRYLFRVIAANDDGVWNTRGAAISFVVPALFYQTIWFRVLCVTIFLSAVVALLLGRLRQITERQRRNLEQRMDDRLNERSRIARELHDSLLQGFEGLLYRLQAVRQMLPQRPDEADRALQVALEKGDEAIAESREAVRGLRSAVPIGRDLEEALRALREECGTEEGRSTPSYRVIVEGPRRKLAPLVQDEIYRIAREAFRNAIRHANADAIEAEITYGEDAFSLRLRDNGVGLDPQAQQREGHWGLQGMRERATQLQGRLEVWGKRGAGTEVELTLPAGLAYGDGTGKR